MIARIASYGCEHPCNAIQVRGKKKVLYHIGAEGMRSEPYKMYDLNHATQTSHVMCTEISARTSVNPGSVRMSFKKFLHQLFLIDQCSVLFLPSLELLLFFPCLQDSSAEEE